MNTVRACLPCKAAKVTCDLARPTCGSCNEQNIICTGLPLDSLFVFRNENEVAKRNSRRARGQRRQSPEAALVSLQAEQSSPNPEEPFNVSDHRLRESYPWLNYWALTQIPNSLKRDAETRAIERFFVNWTLYPDNRGLSPGYMDDLPRLYYSTEADSVLWSSVRAVAYADIGGGSFQVKARQQYGTALNQMRVIANDQQQIASDTTLYATLLMDDFELMYLGRNDPLGPHRDAIKHILRNRGDGQLYTPTRFSLWRLIHYRLQFWQMLSRDEPIMEQQAWLSKLNLERPELRICAEVLKMHVLNAAAKQLAQTSDRIEAIRANQLDRVQQLIQDIQNHLVVTESWTSEMAAVWKVHIDDRRSIGQFQTDDIGTIIPMPNFPYPTFLSYDDLWLAYIWNFYSANLMILRESLVDMLSLANRMQGQGSPNIDQTEGLRQQRDWIEQLSASILGSFPMLLGFTDGKTQPGWSRLPQQGKMAGRLFALFAMWAIQKAKFTSTQHKQTASEVIDWINSRHGLR
ncbi:hypothetical protein BDV96DRAFT_617327 [Lophiotrema nucula]|uniref:Zn(2)-C6 fungal-type domain-containing protein n=1 Tax=Lophiotrema nucula TaxID=690887 RepID=A0A6A5YJQ5_9PLEO|nr:hypothetical protein BDV96DRAFT_617327 [Lophiotrema nucula]